MVVIGIVTNKSVTLVTNKSVTSLPYPYPYSISYSYKRLIFGAFY